MFIGKGRLRISALSEVDSQQSSQRQRVGGTIICYGCSCTFTNVRFHACSLVALAGAQVKLVSSNFANMGSSTSGLSLFAHGAGTTVNIQGSIVMGGTQGLAVQAGAHLEASGMSISTWRWHVPKFSTKDHVLGWKTANCGTSHPL